MINCTHLHKTYKIRIPSKNNRFFDYFFNPNYEYIKAIDNVSFQLSAGECLGILGENGAGKSTLIKSLCGIQRPSSGRIEILGHDPIRREKSFFKKIGVLFGQKSSLWWDLPVIDSLNAFKRIYAIESSEYEARLKKILYSLNLEAVIHKPVRVLSLGERIKCELCAILIHGPKLIMLDEPTIGVDVASRYQLREYLNFIAEEHNVGIIITSHDMGDIETCCQRVMLLDAGNIVFNGSINKFKKTYITDSKINIIKDNSIFSNFEEKKLKSILPKESKLIRISDHEITIVTSNADDYFQKIQYIIPEAKIFFSKPTLEDVMLKLSIKKKIKEI